MSRVIVAAVAPVVPIRVSREEDGHASTILDPQYWCPGASGGVGGAWPGSRPARGWSPHGPPGLPRADDAWLPRRVRSPLRPALRPALRPSLRPPLRQTPPSALRSPLPPPPPPPVRPSPHLAVLRASPATTVKTAAIPP